MSEPLDDRFLDPSPPAEPSALTILCESVLHSLEQPPATTARAFSSLQEVVSYNHSSLAQALYGGPLDEPEHQLSAARIESHVRNETDNLHLSAPELLVRRRLLTRYYVIGWLIDTELETM